MQRITVSPGRTWHAFLTWLAAGITLAVIVVVMYAATSTDPWTSAAVGVVLTAAVAVAAGVLGFTFGVPRVAGANRRGIVGNTNLEQISDWLTKILVGVGLTQFNAITAGLGRLVGTIAPAFDDGQAAVVFTGALGAYCSGFGFITGWLYARLLLGSAMAEADSRATARDLMADARAAERSGDDRTARELRDEAERALGDDGDAPDAGDGQADRR